MANSHGEGSTGAAALAFLVGAAVGVGIGMLFAPASGRETRRKLKDMAGKAQEKAHDLAAMAQEKAHDLGGRFATAAQDITDGAEKATRSRH